ncbi:MAG: UDP-3-O-(3-hydroxymyristoyl)glucosamine N-acyltransferase [Mariprofundaceae bacterium]|nr:UDP-3-O-(3-hydroxymyristoyl)glucosamine N-acyltransferase [Mariprofundaceae bacterium]
MSELKLSFAEVADLVSGELVGGKAELEIRGVNSLAQASAQELSFLANMKYKADLVNTKSALLLLSMDCAVPKYSTFAFIRLNNPYLGFALLQRFFHPQMQTTALHHVSAVVDASAVIAEDVQLDAQVSIGKNVVVGARSIIAAGCVLADDVVVGEDCLIRPNVVLEQGTQLGNRVIIQAGAVLGSDGFGFAWDGQAYVKIPQVGKVIIADDVEVGANTCIDRGALENTMIGQGVKLDNLIQIAHNVEIGAHTVIAAQAAFGGSAHIGQGCQFGAQSAVAGHLKLIDGCIVGAKAGVIGDVKVKGMVSGFPAVPHRHWLKASALFNRLPKIWQKIKSLTDGEK